ncbi:hypothetical protein [uncultured Chryseobacterium sp.]|uniref:hypothetical protein n=1 Tax=uncultured Chryseobacterium sp. TaxID=259322 RepID=UPI0025FB4167|nr:hypothetical protein [uncultured Chryseobacterium sp.]
MEKITVQYLPEIAEYLNELTVLLFQKNYFSTLESSVSYIEKLIDFIDHKINLYPKRYTPEHLLELGSNYVFYRANPSTSWYVFFENFENQYLITYITNNHSEIINLL